MSRSCDIDSRYLLLAIVVVFFDRLSKWLALTFLHQSVQITSFLEFELVFNRGVSWGFFQSEKQAPLLGLTLLIIVGLLCYTAIQRMNQRQVYGEVAVLAGACSNMVDRFMYGGVIDFISISYHHWSWPIFNVADIAIVLGVFYSIWRQKSL